jgi:hypothetical protein
MAGVDWGEPAPISDAFLALWQAEKTIVNPVKNNTAERLMGSSID